MWNAGDNGTEGSTPTTSTKYRGQFGESCLFSRMPVLPISLKFMFATIFCISGHFKFYGHWRRVLSWFISNFQSSGRARMLTWPWGGNPVNCEPSSARRHILGDFKKDVATIKREIQLKVVLTLKRFQDAAAHQAPSPSFTLFTSFKWRNFEPNRCFSNHCQKPCFFSEAGSTFAKFLHGGGPLVCLRLQRRRRWTQCCSGASELSGD